MYNMYICVYVLVAPLILKFYFLRIEWFEPISQKYFIKVKGVINNYTNR